VERTQESRKDKVNNFLILKGNQNGK